MLQSSVRALVVVALGSLGLGCSSGDDEAAIPSLTESCAGDYRCVGGGKTVSTTLARDAGACMAGQIRLAPEGTAVVQSAKGTWTGDASAFSVCFGTACLQCTSTTAPPASGAGKKCLGSPSGCNGSAGSCSTVRGCSMRQHVRYNGTLEGECEGSAEACGEFYAEEGCRRQGCRWE